MTVASISRVAVATEHAPEEKVGEVPLCGGHLPPLLQLRPVTGEERHHLFEIFFLWRDKIIVITFRNILLVVFSSANLIYI